MKEKYFSRIKTVGIFIVIITWLMCIIPYVGYFTDEGVGVPHTIGSYWRLLEEDELKGTEIGKSVSKKLKEDLFKSLVKDVSDFFDEKKIIKWDAETRRKMIPELMNELSSYRLILEKDELEQLLSSVMQDMKPKIYRNGVIAERFEAEGKNISSNPSDDFYTSLVMMALAFFISLYCVSKYRKDSKIWLGIAGLGAALLGGGACLRNEIKLANAIKTYSWPEGTKLWTFGPYIAGVTYGVLLIYAMFVIIIDLRGCKKLRKEKSSL